MKFKNLKGLVLSFILGGMVLGGIGVAAVTLTANEVKYTPKNSKYTVNTAKEALDELYELSVLNNYELAVSDSNEESSLDTIVPENLTKGILVAVISSGNTFKTSPIVSGDGIVESKTLFEINHTGGAGVMMGIKVMECVFNPNGTIKTSDGINSGSTSVTNLIFK